MLRWRRFAGTGRSSSAFCARCTGTRPRPTNPSPSWPRRSGFVFPDSSGRARREKELALLEATFGECVAEPVARAALVTAPAGVGKSRLRHEVVERVRKQRDVRVFVARGDPVGAGSAFGLARQIVRHAAGLREGSPRAAQRAALARHLGASFEGDHLARLVDFLGELVGAPGDPDAGTPALRAARNDARTMTEWLRRSFEEWLEAECRSHPVLVVIEDLHWGDAPSVGYLGDALRRLAGRPLMVVAFARPEVHDLFPGMSAGALQEIRLPGLTRRAAERLVRACLGEAPADLVAHADRALEGRDRFASPALPVRMLTVRAAILRALGDLERARASAREATALVERIASTIDEPDLRRSYLGDMFSARALALARELGVLGTLGDPA